MVGWTYARAYEASQKYKEKKFIIEKINLHMEDSSIYDIVPAPAGEQPDLWRRRARNWGADVYPRRRRDFADGNNGEEVFEYDFR